MSSLAESAAQSGSLKTVSGMEFAHYYFNVIRGVTRKQSLSPHKIVHWENLPFSLSEKLVQDWKGVFQVGEEQSAAAFTYHVKIGRDYLFHVLSALGANFLNVMYLGVDIKYMASNVVFHAGENYIFNVATLPASVASRDLSEACSSK